MTYDASKGGKRNRRHGHESERMVARYLREQGYPDAETTRRRLGSDGTKQPGDVAFTPGVVLSVKSRKASSWPSWQAQALAEAGPDRIAVVVRRTRGNPRVGEWETRWHLRDCLPALGVPVWRAGTFAEFLQWLTVEEAA